MLALAAACDRPGPDARAATGVRSGTARPADPRIGLPLPPRAKVTDARLTSDDGPGGAIVRLESADRPQDVVAFLREAAGERGWKVRTDVNLGASRLLGLSRPGETLTIEAAAKAPSGARLTIVRARTQPG